MTQRLRSSGSGRLISVGFIAGALAVLAPGLVSPAFAADTAQPDASAVSALVASINSAISALGSGASQQDIEGAITSAVNGSSASTAVIAAALAQVAAAAPEGSPVRAAANAVASAKKSGSGTGTGGVGGQSQSLFGSNSGISSTTGGGTTNYSGTTPP